LRDVIAAFSKAGGKLIDSSPMYGSAESVAGDLVAELGPARPALHRTKVWTQGRDDGHPHDGELRSGAWKVEQMTSCRSTNLLDVGVHTKGTLNDMKLKGRIRYAGITHYTSSAYAEVEKVVEQGKVRFSPDQLLAGGAGVGKTSFRNL